MLQYRTITIASFFFVAILSFRLSHAKGEGKDHVSRLQTYLREEKIWYFGVKDDMREEVSFCRTLALCRVTSDKENSFESLDEIIVDYRISGLEPTKEEKKIGRPLRATRKYKSDRGINEPEIKLTFNAFQPSVGFEYFFLPMLNTNDQSKDIKDFGKVMLVTPDSFSPRFTGEWTYETTNSPHAVVIEGPYFLHSRDQRVVLSGVWKREITLQPLVFTRMSGTATIHIRPATAYYESKENHWLGSHDLAEYSELFGFVTYRMMPIDSGEAKAIELPSELNNTVPK